MMQLYRARAPSKTINYDYNAFGELKLGGVRFLPKALRGLVAAETVASTETALAYGAYGDFKLSSAIVNDLVDFIPGVAPGRAVVNALKVCLSKKE